LVVLVLNRFLGTIAARRCLSQTVPTAGDPWSPEQANNEPTQQNPGHARIFGFPIEPVGSAHRRTIPLPPNPSSGRSHLSVSTSGREAIKPSTPPRGFQNPWSVGTMIVGVINFSQTYP
jgi:hypothetical protein